MIIISTSIAMEEFGSRLVPCCLPPCVIHLVGDLGVGKTTLVRGFLRALGYSGIVKSPTYTLVEPYQIHEHKIYHFDFYRLLDPEELEAMGIRDYLHENALCLIEWPERGGSFTPKANIEIQLFHRGVERCLKVNTDAHLDLSLLKFP